MTTKRPPPILNISSLQLEHVEPPPEGGGSPEIRFAGPQMFPAGAGAEYYQTDDLSKALMLRETIIRDVSDVLEIVLSSQLDSQKTEKLTEMIATVDESVMQCFAELGHWNPSTGRFEGAPDWAVLVVALERLRDEHSGQEHVVLELDLDEELIDTFADRSSGFMSFAEFQMMLAEADNQG